MDKPKFLFKAFLFFLVASAFPAAFAQTDKQPQQQADPCYEVVLQVLSASNDAGEKAALPASLANSVKKLKTLYAYSDYRLMNTYLQRTNGFIEYKSLLNDAGMIAEKSYPIFSEWALKGLRFVPNAQGRNVFQVDNFRYGARVPIAMLVKDEGGKLVTGVNYESIYTNTMRFTLNENEPTVVASLAGARPDELLFFVLTVKSAE